jgi:hypothetical protein
MLRFLTPRDLRSIHANPKTTLYVRRCIERLEPGNAPKAEITD